MKKSLKFASVGSFDHQARVVENCKKLKQYLCCFESGLCKIIFSTQVLPFFFFFLRGMKLISHGRLYMVKYSKFSNGKN